MGCAWMVEEDSCESDENESVAWDACSTDDESASSSSMAGTLMMKKNSEPRPSSLRTNNSPPI